MTKEKNLTRMDGTHSFTVSDNDFMVVKYKGFDGVTFTACGKGLPIVKGIKYSLYGNWKKTKYGNSFFVEYFDQEMPTTEKEFINYMMSLKCGIGRTKAKSIYKVHEKNVWNVIEKQPDDLKNIPGITEKQVKRLKKRLQETNVLRELYKILGDRADVSEAKAGRLVEVFGGSTIGVIRNKPYNICGIAGFSFSMVDSIALGMGFSPSDHERIKAGIMAIIALEQTRGNVCVPYEKLVNDSEWKLNHGFQSKVVSKQDVKGMLVELSKSGKLVYSSGMVYAKEMFDLEKRTVADIKRLMSVPPENINEKEVDRMIEMYETENNFKLADSQKLAVKKSMSYPVSIITGGPGTGKTTVIRCILWLYEQWYGKNFKIMQLAPTGRAAGRMTEQTSYPSQTIHSAVEFMGEKKVANPETKLDADLFIVDECSMMDQFIASTLVHKIREESRVIFVGDPDQLPSVGAGNVLADMIASEVIPTTKLNVIYRQAADNPIVGNSALINLGDPHIKLDDRFQFVTALEEENCFERSVQIYKEQVAKEGIENVILLCPMRRYKEEYKFLNVDALNRRLQEEVNPPRKNEPSIKVGGIDFRRGDKVMCMVNKTADIKNGDVGYIKRVYQKPDPDDASSYNIVADIIMEGKIHTFDEVELKDFDLAYATTVHKSQGSEYKVTLMIMSNAHKNMLRRNLLYTGVTRAKEKVILIGSKKAVVTSIANDKVEQRYTLLAARLNSALVNERRSA